MPLDPTFYSYINCQSQVLSDSDGNYKRYITPFFQNSRNILIIIPVYFTYGTGNLEDYSYFIVLGGYGNARVSYDGVVYDNTIGFNLEPYRCGYNEIAEIWLRDNYDENKTILLAQFGISYEETVYGCVV